MGNCKCSLYGFWNRESWGWQNCWGNELNPLIWYGKADQSDTSQHLFDPYSLDHLTSGVIQYILLPPYGPGQYCVDQSLTFDNPNGTKFPWEWFLINVGGHTLWELIENTPCCIAYFRTSGVDPAYVGDSVINTIGDIIVNAIGYILTWALVEFGGWWTPIILLIVLQLISWYMGAGFIMIAFRALKDCFCPDENDNNDNNSERPETEEERAESVALNVGGGNQSQYS